MDRGASCEGVHVIAFDQAFEIFDRTGSADDLAAAIRAEDRSIELAEELNNAVAALREDQTNGDLRARFLKAHSDCREANAPPKFTIEEVRIDPAKVRMPRMRIPGGVQEGAINIVFGGPGSGKSTYTALEIVALASGEGAKLLGKTVIRSRVAVIWTDEGGDMLTAKINAVCLKHGITAEQIQGWLYEVKLDTVLDSDDSTVEEISRKLEGMAVDVLVVDSFSSNAPTVEGRNEDAAKFLSKMNRLFRTIVFLHHSRKTYPGQDEEEGLAAQRGASATGGAVRVARQFLVEKGKLADGEALYKIVTVKFSNEKEPEPKGFQIHGCRVNDDTAPVPVAEPVDMNALANPWKGISLDQAKEILRKFLALPDFDRCESKANRKWAGYGLGQLLGLDPDNDMGRMAKGNKDRSGKQMKNRDDCDKRLRDWKSNSILAVKHLPNKGRSDDRGTPVYIQGSEGLG